MEHYTHEFKYKKQRRIMVEGHGSVKVLTRIIGQLLHDDVLSAVFPVYQKILWLKFFQKLLVLFVNYYNGFIAHIMKTTFQSITAWSVGDVLINFAFSVPLTRYWRDKNVMLFVRHSFKTALMALRSWSLHSKIDSCLEGHAIGFIK